LTDLLYHLPLVLVVFVIVLLGVTDLAIGVESPVLVTLLAPTLWVGLYFLGSNRAARKES
jgi:hypothetical protein